MATRNNNSSREEVIRQELRVTADLIPQTQQVMYSRIRRVRPPVFRDLNPVSQLLPQVCEEFVENGLMMDTSETRPAISLPEEYCRFDSAETSTLLSMLLDSSHTRMTRLLNRVHIRAMLREDRYYQIVDDPQLYFRSKCTDLPAFHNRVVLYLTTPGVLVYLKQTNALTLLMRVRSKGVLPRTGKMQNRREKRQSSRRQPQADFASIQTHERRKVKNMTPFIDPYAFQYATYVHCYEGDLLRFQLDYLAVKRDYQDAVPILLDLGWLPNSPSVILYRRRYYQYMTPFLDWVDMIRYQLKTSPNISIVGFYERLLDSSVGDVDIDDLKFFGHTMLECVELRRLTKANCDDKCLRGLYAGRRIYRNKEPRCHSLFAKAFESTNGVVRPVLPNAYSPTRRFLAHLNYYDRRFMTSLPQILSLVDHMLRLEFFSMHPICLGSNIHFEPLVFQIYDFVWSIRQGYAKDGFYLRNESWESIKNSEDAMAWYQRWDVFNCISMLFSICQRAIERDADEALVERLVRQLIDVMRSSHFLEAFYCYSYFDTYLGLNSAINCVPNLKLSSLLRVLQTVPFHLAGTLSVGEVTDSFSERFWRASYYCNAMAVARGDPIRPRTMQEISERLMTLGRRCCVRQAPVADSVESMSGMSAMGSTGAVALFCRNFEAMQPVSPIEEAGIVDNDRMHEAHRVYEENQHLAEYRRTETDYRYGQFFTDAYYMAKGRPRLFFDERRTFHECVTLSMLPYSHQHHQD